MYSLCFRKFFPFLCQWRHGVNFRNTDKSSTSFKSGDRELLINVEFEWTILDCFSSNLAAKAAELVYCGDYRERFFLLSRKHFPSIRLPSILLDKWFQWICKGFRVFGILSWISISFSRVESESMALEKVVWTCSRWFQTYCMFGFQNTELYRHYVCFGCLIAHSKAHGDWNYIVLVSMFR